MKKFLNIELFYQRRTIKTQAILTCSTEKGLNGMIPLQVQGGGNKRNCAKTIVPIVSCCYTEKKSRDDSSDSQEN